MSAYHTLYGVGGPQCNVFLKYEGLKEALGQCAFISILFPTLSDSKTLGF